MALLHPPPQPWVCPLCLLVFREASGPVNVRIVEYFFFSIFLVVREDESEDFQALYSLNQIGGSPCKNICACGVHISLMFERLTKLELPKKTWTLSWCVILFLYDGILFFFLKILFIYS